ncbi:MAG: retropepsin-like aspartic protease [Pseudomonadota bacterium]
MPTTDGKRERGRGDSNPSGGPNAVTGLVVKDVLVNQQSWRALIDTGCTTTLVTPRVTKGHVVLPGGTHRIKMMDGTSVGVLGCVTMPITIDQRQRRISCQVVREMLSGIDVIIGLNAITLFGGMDLSAVGRVTFGAAKDGTAGVASLSPSVLGNLQLDDENFSAKFDGAAWTVKWKWKDGLAPDFLKNSVGRYGMARDVAMEFEGKLDEWVSKGYLVPYDEVKHGLVKGLIPMFAVEQTNKKKVRPVLDYREMNGWVDIYTGASVICASTIRKWRRKGVDCAVLDLKDAYLQLYIDESLWSYQTVMHGGRRWCLTRLGFGLNVAPMIMSAILQKVLSLDAVIAQGADSYIDDLYIDESVVPASVVQEHLRHYG